MDIYHFIESKDVRDHLKQMNYSFNPMEAAYLVRQCDTATFEEKMEACRQITDEMPNCSFAQYRNDPETTHFHGHFREFINSRKSDLEQFLDGTGAVFIYRINNCVSFKLFRSFDECRNAAISRCREEDYCGEIEIEKYEEDKVDNCDLNIGSCRLNSDGKVMKLSYGQVFFHIKYPEIPLPFQKGDILHRVSDSEEEKPFVLDKIDDILSCRCFGASANGFLKSWYEEPLELEHCRKPLKGVHRALTPVSSFLKGDIDLEDMMNAYKILTRISAEEDNAAGMMALNFFHDDYDMFLDNVGFKDIFPGPKQNDSLARKLDKIHMVDIAVEFGEDDEDPDDAQDE